MRSRKQSNTATRRIKQQLEEPRFFLDINIAGEKLLRALRKAGFNVIRHQDLFDNAEEPDPWILYRCGKLGLVVIAADDRYRRTWTHIAAMSLGKTAAFCFTENNAGPKNQARNLIAAKKKIFNKIRRTVPPFIVCIGKNGVLRELDRMPEPCFHKFMRQCDWDSYQRAKMAEDEVQRKEARGIITIPK